MVTAFCHRRASRLVAALTGGLLAVGLGACAAEPIEAPEPIAAPTTAPEPEPATEPEPEPEPEPELVFAMPTDCTEILPTARVASLEAQNLQLLGGPGSIYGDDFFFDETPEQLVGGISCVWGQEGVDLSTILLSVAPLNAATRAQTIDDLIAQGYIAYDRDDSSLAYGLIGDAGGPPAIYNLITNDAWFSMLNSLGGRAGFDESILLTEELRGVAYGALE
ncbi:hypothetical protein EV140_1866 [Microcella alkaliphila]|uniref:Lipoprotein n=1 Tax=Microcella alkaliphila TaxID=279828 RepID=A0A4Q7TJ27_9MICO|nr:hypothetical protein [Microcella alkaliphila]RZT59262.1 hypothetical protein EV140_1866 [Microcella alkaliphila]